MLKGETVILEREGEQTLDAMGDPVYTDPVLETINNVLVQPGATKDLTGNNRPEGVTILFTLHFPKDYDGYDFRGLRIKVRGDWTEVVGEPAFYTADNTPGDWNYPVEVKRCDG